MHRQHTCDGEATGTPASTYRRPDAADIARKRKMVREKMQRYRKRIVSKADALKAAATSLEADLAYHMATRRSCSGGDTASRWLLSWKDVADSLAHETAASQATRDELARSFQQQRHLIHAMQSWVDRVRGGDLGTPRAMSAAPSQSSWRHVTLCADAWSRKAGMDWLTLNLHANTDRMFQRCNFPPLTAPAVIDDFVVDDSNPDGLVYLWRDQRDIDAPFDDVRRVLTMPFFQDQLTTGLVRAADLPDLESLAVVDAPLLQTFGGDVQYSHHRDRHGHVHHFLTREFRHQDRYVLVSQTVHADDHLPNAEVIPRRQRMDWFVLDRLPSGRTKLRLLTVSSQRRTPTEGFVSLDEEAASWGMDLSGTPDQDKPTALVRHVEAASRPFLGVMNVALARALAPISKR